MKKVEVFLYETVSNFEIARKRGQAEAIIEKALGMVGLSFNEVKENILVSFLRTTTENRHS